MNQALKDKLKTLPARPGIYFHKDAKGEVIYVGKASVLKNRVRQYFNREHHDAKTRALVADIAMTDWIETDSEIDALFLENEMIKRYMPRYNILLRDDKNVCYVRINFNDEWPTVTITRTPLDDRADYIGPFYNTVPIKKALRYLRKPFPYLAKPSDRESKLMQQLRLTPSGTSAEYKADLHMLVRYLNGDWRKIQKDLEREMKQAAHDLRFEYAAAIRNQLTYLNELKKQIIFGQAEFMDISKDKALVGARDLFRMPEIPRRIEGYDISHQGGRDVVGSMVVATNGVADKREYRKFKISKQRNDDYAAMDEVIRRRFSERHKNWGKPDLIVVDGGAPQVKAIGDLVKDIPLVGIAKENDEIAVCKSYSHISTKKLDDLIADPIPGVSITTNGEVYMINLHVGARHTAGHSFTFRGSAIPNPYTDLLKLLQRLRDESHRFAITYHESVKRHSHIRNELEEIPGVGPATRRKLMRHFGSIKQIREASLSDIQAVVGNRLASLVKSYLNNPNQHK